MDKAYFYVLCSSAFWVVATQFFAVIGNRMPIRRLGLLKAWVAFAFFFVTALFTSKLTYSFEVYWPLLLSGALGFGLGDLFLFYAIAKLGPAKTMLLNTFQPFLIALMGYVILGEKIPSQKLLGILLLVLCIFFLSRDKEVGSFKFTKKLVFIALIGITLDGMGLILSKMSFERSTELDTVSANAIRIFAALVFLNIYGVFKKQPLGIQGIDKRDLKILTFSTLLGNCMGLLLFMHAISLGNPAIISALGGTSPVLASIYEHAKARVYPSAWFILSLLSMGGGIYLILN
jgi:drug/metabolite transporter (DMT)-like permease